MDIRGIKGLTVDEINCWLRKVPSSGPMKPSSLIVVSFKRRRIYFQRRGEHLGVVRGLPYTMLSLILACGRLVAWE